MKKYLLFIKRVTTALFLPVDPNRKGECLQCTLCCSLAFRCPCLDENNRCKIYSEESFLGWRPSTCTKYPRVKSEQIISPCGYRFEEKNEQSNTP